VLEPISPFMFSAITGPAKVVQAPVPPEYEVVSIEIFVPPVAGVKVTAADALLTNNNPAKTTKIKIKQILKYVLSILEKRRFLFAPNFFNAKKRLK